MRFPKTTSPTLRVGSAGLRSVPLEVLASDEEGRVFTQPPAYTALGSADEIEYIVALAKPGGLKAESADNEETRLELLGYWVSKAVELGMESEARSMLRQATDLELKQLQVKGAVLNRTVRFVNAEQDRRGRFPWKTVLIGTGVVGALFLGYRHLKKKGVL